MANETGIFRIDEDEDLEDDETEDDEGDEEDED